MCCWRKKAVVTCGAGITVSVLLSLPLSVFLQCKVRRGCDGVTCWDEACMSLALLACDEVPLTCGTLASLRAALFLLLFICTDFGICLISCVPGCPRSLPPWEAGGQSSPWGCYLQSAGAGAACGVGTGAGGPSLHLGGRADTGSFCKGGFWCDCRLRG